MIIILPFRKRIQFIPQYRNKPDGRCNCFSLILQNSVKTFHPTLGAALTRDLSGNHNKNLTQVLFDVRAGNSNLAKSLSEEVQSTLIIAMYKDETYTEACKITETNRFSPILVTSIHKTDSF